MGSAPILFGREGEQQRLAAVLDLARDGAGGVLVVRGEAGIGKTALLADAIARASDLAVVQISGAEIEMELAYAGLQQLCTPLMGFVDRLPVPQANALRVAFGLEDGAAPDRLLVSFAVLTLLAEASSDQPIVCVVDDAQWIDTATLQTMAFVARQILADPVSIIFGVRDDGVESELGMFPELLLHGLDARSARAMLDALLPSPVDEHIRETLLAEAHGNPLALSEVRNALRTQELDGGYALATAMSTESRIRQTVMDRLRELPSRTVTLLLIAAAEPAGRSEWVWWAATSLGIDGGAAEPAQSVDLIHVNGGIQFRHPLIRAAVYGSATPTQRRRVHRALAEVIAGRGAADYRAWHAAHAVGAADEQVAHELVNVANRASARGGVAGAAAFLALAVKLTPDPVVRAHRALDAALTKLQAGLPDAARQILTVTAECQDDESVSARAELIRARIALATRRDEEAPPLLLAAAGRLAAVDVALSRETYLEAISAAILAGRLTTEENHTTRAVARAAEHAPPAPQPARSIDLLLDGLVVRLNEGRTAAASRLQQAMHAFLQEDSAVIGDPRWHDLSHRVCLDLFDLDTYDQLIDRQVTSLRQAGSLSMLPVALWTASAWAVTCGRFTDAASLLDESDAIIAATGAPVNSSSRAYLAAYQGEVGGDLSVEASIESATTRGEGFDVTVALYATTILYNALGRYPEAFAAALTGARYDDVGLQGYLLAELVESAVRAGEQAVAADALARLLDQTSASPTPTALGLASRSKALVTDGPQADADFRDAVANLNRSPARLYLARTHLVYGEWLRRAKRRAEARVQLVTAHEMFTAIGANGFAARASRELEAGGEGVKSATTVADGLTAQERHIVKLARDGLTNPEIGYRLFISTRTVEWHLSKIFIKLAVKSRRELRDISFEHF
ncbi:helix-turn-helix transcriptional regulator [Mycolicibacterium moriokaense]|nr:helix-turn-helix transcriptional regulator [Mycolicibacterium moriokaense]